jgi:hypothetical protein
MRLTHLMTIESAAQLKRMADETKELGWLAI